MALDNAVTDSSTTHLASRQSVHRASLIRPRHPQGPRTRPNTPGAGSFTASGLVGPASASSSRAQLEVLGEDVQEVAEHSGSTEGGNTEEVQHSRESTDILSESSVGHTNKAEQSESSCSNRPPFVEEPDSVDSEKPRSPEASVDEVTETAVEKVKPAAPEATPLPSSPAPSYITTPHCNHSPAEEQPLPDIALATSSPSPPPPPPQIGRAHV